MSAYYVIGIVIAVGAVVLSAIGLTREDFPPSLSAGRALMIGAAVLVASGITALIVTTHREHPREEAAEASEQKAQEPAAAKGGAPAPERGGEAARVPVTEKEFSIALAGGKELKAGPQTFAVSNKGQIQHDLAIEGKGLGKEPKTPLIDAGKTADLKVDLKPGKYRFFCTVPGHAQSGMQIDVTVK